MRLIDWFSSFRFGRKRRGASAGRRPRRAVRRIHPALETLEDRKLLATYVIEQLTFTGADSDQFEPSISDDGARIAFLSNADLEGSGRNADQRTELFLYDARTERFRQITDGLGVNQATEIDLSGDGNRIAFTSTDDLTGKNSEGNQEVFLYDIAAGHFTQVSDGPSRINQNPSISFDGSRLTYFAINFDAESDGTFLADLTGPVPTRELVLRGGANPSISGDGSKVAMESTRDLGQNPDLNREIFLYDVASRSIRQITHTQGAFNLSPSLSGDGAKLALSSNADLAGVGQDEFASPYVYDDEVGVFTKASSTFFVCCVEISADGTRVAHSIPRGSGVLAISDLATNNDITLAAEAGLPLPGSPEPGLSLSADGGRLALVYQSDALAPDAEGNFELFLASQAPPVANDDLVTTPEDTQVSLNVLENDVDPMQGPLTLVTFGSLPEHGLATFDNQGQVVYTPDDNYFGADSFTYVVENVWGLRATGTVHVNVLPVNDPTLIEAPDAASVNEDEPLVFSQANGNGITISDVDIGEGPLEIQLTVTGGTLTLGDVSGTTGDQKDNVTTFLGQREAVNRALEGLTFTPGENYNGPAAIELKVQDLLAGALDPAGNDVHVLNITVHAVNDAPVNTVPGPQTGFEDNPLAIAGVSVFDVDAAEGDGLLLVTLSVRHGTLHVNPAVPGGVLETQIAGNGASAVQLTATQEAINATLAAAEGLVYLPDIDFHGEDELVVATNDQGNMGAPGPLADLDVVSIQVLSVEEQVGKLYASIETLATSGSLGEGNAKSLLVKLQNAQKLLLEDKPNAAILIVQAFQREVESLVEEGALSKEDGAELLDAADAILAGMSRSLEG